MSVPLSFFAGIGAASRFGILIKGSNYLELMSKANIFVFDKTGTLTKGNFAVTDVSPADKKTIYFALPLLPKTIRITPLHAQSLLVMTVKSRKVILSQTLRDSALSQQKATMLYIAVTKNL